MAHLIKSTKLYLAAITVLLLAAFLATGLVFARDSAFHSTSPVYWSGGEQVSGSSTLLSNSDGVSATYEAAGFTPGNAVTGPFIIRFDGHLQEGAIITIAAQEHAPVQTGQTLRVEHQRLWKIISGLDAPLQTGQTLNAGHRRLWKMLSGQDAPAQNGQTLSANHQRLWKMLSGQDAPAQNG